MQPDGREQIAQVVGGLRGGRPAKAWELETMASCGMAEFL